MNSIPYSCRGTGNREKKGKKEDGHKPGSVYGNHLSTDFVTKAFKQSTRRHERTTRLLFDFAPDEACTASIIADTAVGSYPTFSPLPLLAVCFLLRYL